MYSAISITGTRKASHSPYLISLFENALRPFTCKPVTQPRFLLGGALGVDNWALDWLATQSLARIIVVVPVTLDAQPEVCRQTIKRYRDAGRVESVIELNGTLTTPGYRARNRYLVDHTELTIAFPCSSARPSSPSDPPGGYELGGTTWTMGYATGKGHALLTVPYVHAKR